MTIDILCRVVDNFGDIGFVYRLSRALAELPDAPRLRLIVDNLAAFAQLCPQVRPDTGLQDVDGMTVVRWDNPGEDALAVFLANRPRMVLECYACGRPDWFETILFDPADPVLRHIVNLEYLTAEPWARDFHLLPSLTRSPLVRKSVFMPGFEPGTGGLLQDSAFVDVLDACADPEKRLNVRRAALRALEGTELMSEGTELSAVGTELAGADSLTSAFWFLIFSYEHDFSSIVDDLAAFSAKLAALATSKTGKTGSQNRSAPPLLALVAAGRSSGPFLEAWNRAGRPFPVLELPFLGQPLWDRFLVASDFAVIRGEESFSRAALTGRPFLWQCYPFGDRAAASGDLSDLAGDHGGQLPKVHAFLNLVRSRVSPADFAAFERLTLSFNRADSAGLIQSGATPDGSSAGEPASGELLAVLRAIGNSDSSLSAGFAAWSRNVRNLGNLASNLLTFMRDLG